jgi:cell division septum initiation protein DivIVA
MDNGVENVSDLREKIQQLEAQVARMQKDADVDPDLRIEAQKIISMESACIEWGATAERSVQLCANRLQFIREHAKSEAEARLARYESQAVEVTSSRIYSEWDEYKKAAHAKGIGGMDISSWLTGQLLDALRSLAVMREENERLTKKLLISETMVEADEADLTRLEAELSLRTQERDTLQAEHDDITALLKQCGYGTIDEMLPKFRESWTLNKERDAALSYANLCDEHTDHMKRGHMPSAMCVRCRLTQATNLRFNAEKERDALRDLAAAAYQFAGANDAPVAWLDALSNAARGETFSTDRLLPYVPAWKLDALTERSKP